MPLLNMRLAVTDAYVEALPRLVNAFRGVQVLAVEDAEPEEDQHDVPAAVKRGCEDVTQLTPCKDGLSLFADEREVLGLATDGVFRPPELNWTIREALSTLGRLRHRSLRRLHQEARETIDLIDDELRDDDDVAEDGAC